MLLIFCLHFTFSSGGPEIHIVVYIWRTICARKYMFCIKGKICLISIVFLRVVQCFTGFLSSSQLINHSMCHGKKADRQADRQKDRDWP